MEQKGIFSVLLIVRFLLGFGTAFLLYILSVYFEKVSGLSDTGIFFFIASAIVLIALLTLHRIIRYIGRVYLFTILTMLALFSASIVIFGTGRIAEISAVSVFYIITTVLVVVFDMIAESYSNNVSDGRMHGALLTVWNVGFVVGPFIAGYVLDGYGIRGIFIGLFFIYSSIAFLMAFILRAVHHLNNITHDGVGRLVWRAWHQRWFRHAYLLALVLWVFYVVMVVYMPIYLLNEGYSPSEIGIAFTVMLLPFIFVEYPAGILADTRFGEREMMLFGIALMIGSLCVMLLAPLTHIIAWTIVLFVSRIGAALVESMAEIFFYKHVDARDIGLIDLFRTASSVAYIGTTIVLFGVFALFGESITAPFIVSMCVLIIGSGVAWTMHDTPAKNVVQ